MNNFIKNIFYSFGFKISKISSHKWKVVDINIKNCNKSKKTIQKIIQFVSKIGLFYENQVLYEPLKISGSWKNDQYYRRPLLLKYLKESSLDKLYNLFENMFFNELVSGTWCYQSYNEKKNLSQMNGFNNDYKEFTFIFPKKRILSFKTNIKSWGYENRDTKVIIRPMDLWHSYQHILIEQTLKLTKKDNNGKQAYNFIEIGSGWGGLAYNLKKSNYFNQIVLIDIPINLINAFYFLKLSFSDNQVILSDNLKYSEMLLKKNENKIILIPSCHYHLLQNNTNSWILGNFGSFSLMSSATIDYYLNKIPKKTDMIVQINSNISAKNSGNHIEVPIDEFKYPQEFKEIISGPSLLSNHSGGRFKMAIHKRN